MSYAYTSELWQIERSLPKYNLYLILQFSRYSKDKTRILEFGAGIDALAKLWESTEHQKLLVIEIDPQLQLVLKQRDLFCYPNLEKLEQNVDGIYSSNVLEHIEVD